VGYLGLFYVVFCGFSGHIFSFVYCIVMVFLPALILIVLVLAKKLAGKSISDMTYLVSSGTLIQSVHNFLICFLV